MVGRRSAHQPGALCRSLAPLLSICLIAACDSGEGSAGGGEEVEDPSDSGPVEEEPVTEDHDYILLRLVPSADSPKDWYAGSIAFSVNVQYDTCLQQFYDEHPSWKARESNGSTIFDAWKDTLCVVDVPDRVGCEIQTIAQEFSATSQLLVRYTPDAVDQLTNAVVPVGPFPTETMAGCVPVVRLESGAVVGTQDIGEKVWEAMSFSSNAVTVGQGGVIDAEVTVFHE